MATYLRRILNGNGRRTIFIAAVCLVLLSALSTAAYLGVRPRAAHAANPAVLLLVHGYNDTCAGAFETRSTSGSTAPDDTALTYLSNHGWKGNVQCIGYYNPASTFPATRNDGSTISGGLQEPQSFCGVDAGGSSTSGDTDLYYSQSTANTNAVPCDTGERQAKSNCESDPTLQPLAGGPAGGSFGTADDPIRHLGCLLAWWIYDTYTKNQQPVYILAHSMGGLIVRDAIGEAGHNPSFPPDALDVRKVVTVGTPHGGEYGEYLYGAEDAYCNKSVGGVPVIRGPCPQEIIDMTIGVTDSDTPSPFMQLMRQSQFQAPRGAQGTYWALMAAANQGTYLSSNAEADAANDPYPDGDGVIQADSALSMPADFKILYGSGAYGFSTSTSSTPTFTADPATAYAHEWGVCGTYFNVFRCGAGAPFFLNDTSGQQTTAWICSSACGAGDGASAPGDASCNPEIAIGRCGITDLHVVKPDPTLSTSWIDARTAVPAPRSLAEMVSLLAPPPPTISSDVVITSTNPWSVSVTGSNFTSALVARLTDRNAPSGQYWGGDLPTFSSISSSSSLSFFLPANSPPSGCNAYGPCRISLTLYDTLHGLSASAGLTLPGIQNTSGVAGAASWGGWTGLNSDGNLATFVLGGDNLIHESEQVCAGCEPTWSVWTQLGAWAQPANQAPFAGTPSVARNTDGNLEVFARANNYTTYSIAYNEQTFPDGGWAGWTPMPTNASMFSAGDPTVGRNADGRLEVFAGGYGGSLWHSWQTSPDGAWAQWASLSGTSLGNIAVGRNADGRLEIFVRGTDNLMYHQWQTSLPSQTNLGGNWSGWVRLGTGSNFATNPAVASNADGRMEVFAATTDGETWHAWQTCANCGWSDWSSFGGVTQSDPIVGSNADGRLEFYVRGTDNRMYHQWQSGGGWSGWALLGVGGTGYNFSGVMSVAQNGDGRLETLAQTSDAAFWHAWQTCANCGWSAWNSLGSP